MLRIYMLSPSIWPLKIYILKYAYAIYSNFESDNPHTKHDSVIKDIFSVY